MNDEPFDQLKRMIDKNLADATEAQVLEARIISIDIIRAACDAYLSEHAPENWSEFGAHVSSVVQWAERKQANKKTLFE